MKMLQADGFWISKFLYFLRSRKPAKHSFPRNGSHRKTLTILCLRRVSPDLAEAPWYWADLDESKWIWLVLPRIKATRRSFKINSGCWMVLYLVLNWLSHPLNIPKRFDEWLPQHNSKIFCLPACCTICLSNRLAYASKHKC